MIPPDVVSNNSKEENELSHVNLKVVNLGRTPKEKKCTRITGISPDIKFGLHRNTIGNLERGVLQRVFYVKRDGVFQEPYKPKSKAHFFKTLRKQLRFLVSVNISPTPVSYHGFARMYKGRKYVQHMQSADSLVKRPVCKRDANTKAFGKSEKTNLTEKPDAVQRVVSPQNDRYLVATGRYIKPVEKLLIHQTDEMFGEVTVMKGYSPIVVAEHLRRKWNKFSRPIAVSLDAKRFDQHVSHEALEWEHSIYNKLYDSSELRELLKWQLNVKAMGRCADGFLKYKIKGTRTSGCINTSLGNILIMCALLHAYIKSRNVNAAIVNNGDDSVVIMEEKDLPRFLRGFREWFIEMGFDMKVEKPVTIFEKIEFCQTQPVNVAGEWRMVRQVPLAMAKDSISIKPMDNVRITKRWMHTVGYGGLTLTGGVPICQSFYEMYIRSAAEMVVGKRKRRGKSDIFLSDPSLESGFQFMAHSMEHKGVQLITDNTRLSFWKAFGFRPDTQKGIETHYQQHTTIFRPETHDPAIKYYAMN